MLKLHGLLGRSCISSSSGYTRYCPSRSLAPSSSFPPSCFRWSLAHRYASSVLATASPESSRPQSTQELNEEKEQEPKRWRIISRINPDRVDDIASLTSNWTFDDYERESNVYDNDTELLVDQVRYRNNISLWLILLRYRSRVYGDRGVLDIWSSMHARQVRLPLQGEEAAELWRTVVEAAFHKRRISEVVAYAEEAYDATGETYPLLYDLIIGHYLVKATSGNSGWHWHCVLKNLGLPVKGTFARLVRAGTSSPASLAVFRRLCEDSADRTLYDDMITTLCNQGKHETATQWHDIMIARSDYPSDAAVSGLLMRTLKSADSAKNGLQTEPRRLLNSTMRPVSGKQWTESNNILSRPFMNRVLGEKHGIKPKFISDQVCAKAFATRAVSLDFVMRTLSAFGVSSLGPLAVHQIGLRSANTRDFYKHIKALEELKMKVDDCIYNQLLLKFAINENEALFRAILETDQHPEVFEDKSIQLQLLAQHIHRQDWQQLHLAIIALTHGHKEPVSRAYNILLCHRIASGHVNLVYALIDEMIDNGISIQTSSIRHAFFQWTAARRAGQRTVTQYENKAGLNDMIIMVLHIMRRNVTVSHTVWRQPLIYLGMDGRLQDLEALCLWLTLHYSRHLATYTFEQKQQFYKELFPILLQKAFVSWGFVTAVKGTRKAELLHHFRLPVSVPSPRNELSRRVGPSEDKIFSHVILSRFFRQEAPWTRGIAFLRVLRQCGINIDPHAVRSACRQKLRQLYGCQVSRRRLNRILKQKNRMTFLQTLRHANHAWIASKPLFPQVLKLKKMDAHQQKVYLEQLRASLVGSRPARRELPRMRWRPGVGSDFDNDSFTPRA